MALPSNLITGRTANLPDVQKGPPPGSLLPILKARLVSDTRMNKTEEAYAAELELRLRAGEVAWYRFEAIKLRLAKRTWYTPDFLIGYADGTMEFVEIKGGFVRDDAAVKVKVAREMYPMFRWKALSLKRGEWVEILK